MVFMNSKYEEIVNAQFHKLSLSRSRYRACSIFIPHERYRPVTPMDATRVNRTIL